MDPRRLFADERHAAFCVFCGDPPTTREHVASRILLDDPLPDDLPLASSCYRCNTGFSRDEEYLACLIDCVISGSTDPHSVQRTKVKASLLHSPALAARIATYRIQDASGTVLWKPEDDRVRKVIIKLARAHVAHQFSEPRLDEPSSIFILPLTEMSNEQLRAFETWPASSGWSEIGSRAFVNVMVCGDETYDPDHGWNILQAARYRYLVAEPGQIVTRIVLSEYLAAEVVW